MAAGLIPANVSGMNELDRAPYHTGMRTPLIRSYVQRIDAPPEAVFPLLCPVREREWLDGWAETSELIWSASGVAEPSCVFRTVEPDAPETIWIITDHDPDQGLVAFARVTPGLAAGILRIEVSGCDDGSSTVAIRYTVVPTSPAGEAYAAARYDRTDLLASVVWWERSMNHYLRTGRLLRRDPPATSPKPPSQGRDEGPDETHKESHMPITSHASPVVAGTRAGPVVAPPEWRRRPAI